MNEFSIRLMGDVMIGRLVNKKVSSSGYVYPWGNILNVLKKPGVNLINLETTLTNSKTVVPKVFNFRADPDKVNVLLEANIQGATVANNHILDFSYSGLEETIDVLDNAGIKHTGAGRSLEEAKKPFIITHNKTKIGLIGCTDNEPGWEANDFPGTFYVEVGDPEKLEAEIKNLRKQVDLLIVSIHWGPNMVEEPFPEHIDFAHSIIDMGADLIHGHSSHIFQGIEIYKGKFILYDTGDFIDDYAVDPDLRHDRSFLFECIVRDKNIVCLKLLPVLIDKMQVNIATGFDREWAIARMQYLSSRLGTLISKKGVIYLQD